MTKRSSSTSITKFCSSSDDEYANDYGSDKGRHQAAKNSDATAVDVIVSPYSQNGRRRSKKMISMPSTPKTHTMKGRLILDRWFPGSPGGKNRNRAISTSSSTISTSHTNVSLEVGDNEEEEESDEEIVRKEEEDFEVETETESGEEEKEEGPGRKAQEEEVGIEIENVKEEGENLQIVIESERREERKENTREEKSKYHTSKIDELRKKKNEIEMKLKKIIESDSRGQHHHCRQSRFRSISFSPQRTQVVSECDLRGHHHHCCQNRRHSISLTNHDRHLHRSSSRCKSSGSSGRHHRSSSRCKSNEKSRQHCRKSKGNKSVHKRTAITSITTNDNNKSCASMSNVLDSSTMRMNDDIQSMPVGATTTKNTAILSASKMMEKSPRKRRRSSSHRCFGDDQKTHNVDFIASFINIFSYSDNSNYTSPVVTAVAPEVIAPRRRGRRRCVGDAGKTHTKVITASSSDKFSLSGDSICNSSVDTATTTSEIITLPRRGGRHCVGSPNMSSPISPATVAVLSKPKSRRRRKTMYSAGNTATIQSKIPPPPLYK